MFWNTGQGTFTECTTQCGITGSRDVIGMTVGDVNNDGRSDILVTGRADSNGCTMTVYINKVRSLFTLLTF